MNLSILLQATKQGNPLTQFLPFVLIIVVFYFFMIRPQARKAKMEKKFKEGLQKGDKVVTNGGIHGKIVEVQDNTITLECEAGVRLKVDKWAISADATAQINKAS
jgi:preprotein translocase subunit YajC